MKEKRQNGGTNPLELFDDFNGIGQRNQWNRSTKSMELLVESGGFG